MGMVSFHLHNSSIGLMRQGLTPLYLINIEAQRGSVSTEARTQIWVFWLSGPILFIILHPAFSSTTSFIIIPCGLHHSSGRQAGAEINILTLQMRKQIQECSQSPLLSRELVTGVSNLYLFPLSIVWNTKSPVQWNETLSNGIWVMPEDLFA